MTTRLKTVIVAFVLIFGIIACQKEIIFDLEDSSSLPPANTSDTFHVKIDGVDWSGKSISASVVAGNLLINAAELNLSKAVDLAMPPDIIPGTYDFDIFVGSYIGLYSPSDTKFMLSDSGKLTIIEHNTTTRRIRGNFDFRAVELSGSDTATLSQGYFSIEYN